MHFIPENLKFLRKKNGWTQGDFAKHLGVKRSLIGAYEEGRADPRISFLQLVCDKFSLSLDDLIGQRLDEAGNQTTKDVSGRSLRILPITIDSKSQNETATLVPIKAAAGYLNGYGDVEFIEKLPTFRLPFPELPRGRTYRLFQIEGESMLPVTSGSYVICSYEMDWNNIKNDACYVIVSKSEGVVFKRVLNELKSNKLILKSDNPEYSSYELPTDEIIEVWQAVGTTQIGMEVSNPNPELGQHFSLLSEKLDRIERQLKSK